ncbi:type IV conjugative transfer system protein TraL [uncultured Photobacterium sp.]|uniref:type IV conjugative transfer system protein TraL n=1 Tax=uncultured Photobacterium sp. TaxID=173973 RepID=UPI0026090BBF|nr:type IV conjugative transfer system protein TraL [uncultured Photobacterium sp.]
MAKNDINENHVHVLPENQTFIPMRINDKQMILGMEVDSFGVLMIAMVIGNFTQTILFSLGVGAILVACNFYIKSNYPKGRLAHILWWRGIYVPKETLRFPDCFKRTFYR